MNLCTLSARAGAKGHVSIKTVEAYRANIKENLKLKSSAELVQHAIHWVLSGELP